MNIWHDMNPDHIHRDDFVAVVEISRGSKNKYELDKETGLLKLDRILRTATHYPSNYGFIPCTYADDGDPLDVMIICSEPIQPMTLVRCFPVGVIKMLDDGKNDEKIIAIPFSDPVYNGYRSIFSLPNHIYNEMEHFFKVYKTLEHKETVVNEVGDFNEAMEIISYTIENYKKTFSEKKEG